LSEITKKKKIHHAWLVLIGCCFLEFGTLGGLLDAAGVFFVPVCEDLGFARADLSFYITVYLLSSVLAMPLVARWLPKYDTKKLLTGCILLTCAAMACMSFYTELWQWYISGIVYGFAGSFLFMMSAPILINNWFKKRRGLALGVGMSFSGIGGAVLSPVFAGIIEAVGWRTGYLLAALIVLVLVLPWTLFVFEYKPENMGLKPYGWTKEDDLVTAELQEAHVQPGVPAKVAVRTLPFICLFMFAGLIPYFGGFNIHLPGHGVAVGLSPVVAATLISAVMLGNLVEKLIVGWLNDRVGVEFTVNIQLAMVALGLIGFLVAGNNLILLYMAAFFFGAQNSLVSVSTPMIIRQLFGNKDYVKILAYARIGMGLIGGLGPLTIGMVYDNFGAFAPAFVIGIGIIIFSFIIVRIAYYRRATLAWEDLPADPDKAQEIRFSRTASSL